MNELRTWIITLVSITILCTIVEKFAPQGNLNKYVRLVCGLAVTVVIAMPVISFFKGDFSLDQVVWSEYTKLSENELKKRIDRLQKADSKQMLEIYRESLINDIKTRFTGEGYFIITQVDAVLNEDPQNESFGMIRALYLTLEPGSMSSSGEIPQKTVEQMKNEISEVFKMERDKILIDVSHFNGGG